MISERLMNYDHDGRIILDYGTAEVPVIPGYRRVLGYSLIGTGLVAIIVALFLPQVLLADLMLVGWIGIAFGSLIRFQKLGRRPPGYYLRMSRFRKFLAASFIATGGGGLLVGAAVSPRESAQGETARIICVLVLVVGLALCFGRVRQPV